MEFACLPGKLMASDSGSSPTTPDWLTRRRRLDSILRLQASVLAGDPAQREAIQMLAQALGDPVSDIREAAVAALGDFGPQARAALPELMRATQDESAVVRRRAVRAVGAIAEPEEFADDMLTTVMAATEDEDASVVLQALATLGEFGPHAAAALPALLSAIWTGDVRRRAMAGVALARLGPTAVPSLVQSLSHPSADVRAKAAHILGKIGPAAAEAVSPLKALLNDRDEGVKQEAAEALRLLAQPQ
jgi:HEAT repeat protein